MTKFRQKLVVVDAIQWYKGIEIPHLENLIDPWGQNVDHCRVLQTTNGRCVVSEGDWIITGPKGAKQVCSPGMFDNTYEPLE